MKQNISDTSQKVLSKNKFVLWFDSTKTSLYLVDICHRLASKVDSLEHKTIIIADMTILTRLILNSMAGVLTMHLSYMAG